MTGTSIAGAATNSLRLGLRERGINVLLGVRLGYADAGMVATLQSRASVFAPL